MEMNASLYLRDRLRWFREKTTTRSAEWWLATYSFFESVILPFPTDVFMALMILANRTKTIRLVIITTLASLVGAVALYSAVVVAYEVLLVPVISFFALESAVSHATSAVASYAFVAVFIGAFTPVPYTPVIIASGLLRVDFFIFLVASLVGRGARYTIVALLTFFFGIEVLPRTARYATAATLIALVLFAAFFFFVVNAFL